MREKIHKQSIKVEFIPTKYQQVDILTKSCSGFIHQWNKEIGGLLHIPYK